jgi:hypothetical protein
MSTKQRIEEFVKKWFGGGDKIPYPSPSYPFEIINTTPLKQQEITKDLTSIMEEAVREYCQKHNLVKFEIQPGTLDVPTPDD